MRKILTTVLLIISAIMSAENPYPVYKHLDVIDKQVIPQDTAIRTGVLDNGFTYYVCKNKNPQKRAEFRLLVKCGSCVEKNNERGIAHFTEHMLFKGTKHFPENNVISFMNNNGIKFGHDSNAKTSYENTQYFLKDIPTDNTALLDSCLLLIRDWAADATINKKDVEKERNVIIEEWRQRNVLSSGELYIKDILKNTIYENHLPIGDMRIIKKCSPQLIRNFYKRWYQPQNQAIVVAGDFCPDEMVEKIRLLFGDIERGKTSTPVYSPIPPFDTPQILLYNESMLPMSISKIVIRTPQQEYPQTFTVGDIRAAWNAAKVMNLIDERLKSINQNDDFITSGKIIQSNFNNPHYSITEITYATSCDNWQKEIEQTLKQLELIRRQGFNNDEWENKNGWIMVAYNEDSTAIDYNDTTLNQGRHIYTNSERVESMCDNYYNGKPIINIEYKYETEWHIENSVSHEQLHKEFLNLYNGKNIAVVLLFPQNEQLPSKDEVMAVINRAQNMTDEELKEEYNKTKAKKPKIININDVDLDLAPGTIKERTTRNDSISEVLLSNGVKVIHLKQKAPDNFKRLNMTFIRPSGYSVLNDKESNYKELLSSYMRKYETSTFSPSLSINKHKDELTLRYISEHNIEENFKYLHKILNNNEIDSVAYESFVNNMKELLTYMKNTDKIIPMVSDIYLDELPYASTIDSSQSSDSIDWDYQTFKKIADKYYSNYNGSTLYIQGENEVDSIMPYILKYVATLPSQPEPVKYRVCPSDHFRSTDTIVVNKYEAPSPNCKTRIFYAWEKNFKYSHENHAHNQALNSLLLRLLGNILRIQHSDVYSPFCRVIDQVSPINQMMCKIGFNCNPTQRERIVNDVKQIIHDMAYGNLISQDDIDGFVKECEKDAGEYKMNYEDNLTNFVTQETKGITIDPRDLTYIKQVTIDSLKNYLKDMLDNCNIHVGYITTE